MLDNSRNNNPSAFEINDFLTMQVMVNANGVTDFSV